MEEIRGQNTEQVKVGNCLRLIDTRFAPAALSGLTYLLQLFAKTNTWPRHTTKVHCTLALINLKQINEVLQNYSKLNLNLKTYNMKKFP